MRHRPEIHVMAGVLSDDHGRVLVARRPVGKHLAGRWEFPGGKLVTGETPLGGLARELAEELGVTLESAEPLIRLHHDYPDRRVLLDVWRVTRYSGTPQGLDGQALDWLAPEDLPRIDLLKADRPIVTALRLPRVAQCVEGLDGLTEAAGSQEPLALFWRPAGADTAAAAVREVVRAARRAGHRVLVAGQGVEAAMDAAVTGADGLLLEPGSGDVSLDPSGAFMVGAICTTTDEARAAVQAGAHFLVLVPGAGEAEQRPFAALPGSLGVPAYLGWHPDAASLEPARGTGAHGCAVGPFPGTRA